MAPTQSDSVYGLYRAAITAEFEARIMAQLGLKRAKRRGRQPRLAYTFRALVWLMISQRLEGAGTLAEAVARAAGGQLSGLISRRRVSLNTGGYSRARSRMPKQVMRETTDYLTGQLSSQLIEPDVRAKRPIYLFDGSSLSLAPEAELAAIYPPWSNQRDRSHWPVLKLVVVHEARTGLAIDLAWGPMYGAEAVSEQALAERLMDRLSADAIMMGDRNFGIFWMAYESARRGHGVILRLTAQRAERIAGGGRKVGTDVAMTWTPSDKEWAKHREWPREAAVQGRLLVYQVAGWREPLYLFTTLDLPAEEVASLYKLRWNIETDLRSIKQTVHLQEIRAKSNDMLEKELLAAMAAYNLTRAVIVLAARQVRLQPRELSFSRVYYLVQAWLPRLMDAGSDATRKREFQRLVHAASSCKLPKRKRRRSFPRTTWAKRRSFPERKEPRRKSCK